MYPDRKTVNAEGVVCKGVLICCKVEKLKSWNVTKTGQK